MYKLLHMLCISTLSLNYQGSIKSTLDGRYKSWQKCLKLTSVHLLTSCWWGPSWYETAARGERCKNSALWVRKYLHSRCAYYEVEKVEAVVCKFYISTQLQISVFKAPLLDACTYIYTHTYVYMPKHWQCSWAWGCSTSWQLLSREKEVRQTT